MGYQYFVEFASIIASAVILLDFLRVKHFSVQSTKLVRQLLIISMVSATLNIVTLNAVSGTIELSVEVKYMLNVIFFILEALLPFLYFCYMICTCGRLSELTSSQFFIRALPLFLYYGFLFTNSFTGWLFAFDASGAFIKGPLYTLTYYALAGGYLLWSFVYTLKYKRRLKKHERDIVWQFAIIMAGITIVQTLNPDLLLIGFGFFLCNAVIYISLENPAQFLDGETKLMNKMAFNQYFISRQTRTKRKPFSAICVEIQGFSAVNDLFGFSAGSELLTKVSHAIKRAIPKNNVFKFEKAAFIITEENGRESEIISLIDALFNSPWQIRDTEVLLTVHFVLMRYPEHFKSMSGEQRLGQYLLHISELNSQIKVLEPNDEIMTKFYRETVVERSITRAIAAQSFEVFYQPIHDCYGALVGAEALVRLDDDYVGHIGATELIEAAERTGQIIAVGECVFRKVCRFVKNNVKSGRIRTGRVNVNLSVVQCMQADLSDRFIEIASEEGVSISDFNFELTESSIITLKDRLLAHMNKLAAAGATFWCDDYGTGFSTFTYLLDYPFSVVKFEKRIVGSFLEDRRSNIILKSELEAVSGLGLKSVAEGIEDEEQLRAVRNCCFDFIQGYYYSRPLREADFIHYCKKANEE